MTSPTNSTPDATTEVEPASIPTTMFAVARTQLATMLAIATRLPNSMSSSSEEAVFATNILRMVDIDFIRYHSSGKLKFDPAMASYSLSLAGAGPDRNREKSGFWQRRAKVSLLSRLITFGFTVEAAAAACGFLANTC